MSNKQEQAESLKKEIEQRDAFKVKSASAPEVINTEEDAPSGEKKPEVTPSEGKESAPKVVEKSNPEGDVKTLSTEKNEKEQSGTQNDGPSTIATGSKPSNVNVGETGNGDSTKSTDVGGSGSGEKPSGKGETRDPQEGKAGKA